MSVFNEIVELNHEIDIDNMDLDDIFDEMIKFVKKEGYLLVDRSTDK